MNRTYSDVTDATENFIRELFANDNPLPVTELKVRSAIVHAAVKAGMKKRRAWPYLRCTIRSTCGLMNWHSSSPRPHV